MPRSPQAARGRGAPAAAPAPAPSAGDVYTMAEAAHLKGVSYHTVSRAVRRGKLPAQRLGRMALIAASDLRDWRPMRERAPRKYRRREPNPDATPALLDLASGERVELARRLSTLYEVLHGAATELPLPEFLALLCDRLASALDFRRVSLWSVDEAGRMATRVATFGPPFSAARTTLPVTEMPLLERVLEANDAILIEDVGSLSMPLRTDLIRVTSVFAAPLRVGTRTLGVVFGDCNGEPFTLSPAQLGLAQGMANQAALALEQARLRAAASARSDQLEAILEGVTEAVFACDAAGRMTLLNAATRALLGLSGGQLKPNEQVLEVAARTTRHEFDGRPIRPEETPLWRALQGERVRDREYVIVRPDGSEVAVNVNAQPIRVGETITGAVAIAREIAAERAPSRENGKRLARRSR